MLYATALTVPPTLTFFPPYLLCLSATHQPWAAQGLGECAAHIHARGQGPSHSPALPDHAKRSGTCTAWPHWYVGTLTLNPNPKPYPYGHKPEGVLMVTQFDIIPIFSSVCSALSFLEHV